MAPDAAKLFLRHDQAGADPAFALIASMPAFDVTTNGFDYGECRLKSQITLVPASVIVSCWGT
jgi:hypothetical protein